MTIQHSQLDNPDYAAFAWARYRRLMWWMALVSGFAVICAVFYLKWLLGEVPVMMMVFTALGVFCSVLLGSALMGLVFLSSGSGHDEIIAGPVEDAP